MGSNVVLYLIDFHLGILSVCYIFLIYVLCTYFDKTKRLRFGVLEFNIRKELYMYKTNKLSIHFIKLYDQ